MILRPHPRNFEPEFKAAMRSDMLDCCFRLIGDPNFTIPSAKEDTTEDFEGLSMSEIKHFKEEGHESGLKY